MDTVPGVMTIGSQRAARPVRDRRFFQVLSALLLLAVLVGFAVTFFLRPFTGYGPMHWYLWLHGTVLTGWFVLSLVQTSLVAGGRTEAHRRLGVWGAWLAGAVVIVGIAAILAGPRDAITGTNGFVVAEPARMGGGPFLNAIGGLVLFAAFVTSAVILRRQVEFHRRLMLMASIAIIFPAAGRIPILMQAAQFPFAVVAFIGGGIAVFYTIGLPIALAVYDLVTRRRRLHPATVIALIAYFPVFLSQFIFAEAPLVQAAIAALE